ncbi:31381_t:CDS:10 [Gigaspora margarita]|uniref:DNA topoisomerase n=1 Tax=Gigaspora margarita TaxID=4874 RepID=A0ABM8W5G2_GIGMA|nr:31381_t:CDS:10 [Gigaspora margarita]
MSIKELMITEKPSLALKLVSALAPNGKFNTREILGNRVYEFTHEYRGHIYSVRFEKRYKNWNIDPIKLFTAPLENQEVSEKEVIENLLRELKGKLLYADSVVFWMSPDEEGENIIFEIIDQVFEEIKATRKMPCKFERAKFYETTASKIREAYDNLVLPNRDLSSFAQARKEFDLRYFNDKHGNSNFRAISYGPCQIPALSFCVDRHDEIQSFIPQLCWSLSITVANQNGHKVILKKSCNDITLLQNKIKRCKKARVKDVIKRRTTKPKPNALNMVEMLKYCSLYLGIGPYAAMSTAEKLYEKGYITNPHTETTIYSKDFDFDSRLAILLNHHEWGLYAKELLKNKLDRPIENTIKDDQPPIVPVKLARDGDLQEDQRKLYDYIALHFLGSLSSDVELEEIHVSIEIKDELFECSENTVVNVIKVEPIDDETRPPEYLTESELIGLMQRYNIGTHRSIPTHIETICKRNYVMVQGTKRNLIPTDLEKIEPTLSDPEERNKIELALGFITEGAGYKKILKPILKSYTEKFKNFRKQIVLMDEEIRKTLSSYATSGKILSECPYDGPKSVKISNSSENTAYPLCAYCFYPPKVNELKGLKYCDHSLCMHSLINNGICKCPMECGGQVVLDKTLSGLYLSTQYLSTQHFRSGFELKLSEDSEYHSSEWKLSCENNNCFEILFFNDVEGVSILDGKFCEKESCSSRILKLETSTEIIQGCILCDDQIRLLFVKVFTLKDKDVEFTTSCKKRGCPYRKIKVEHYNDKNDKKTAKGCLFHDRLTCK